MNFPIDIVLEQRMNVASILLGIQISLDLPGSLIVLGDNRFARSLCWPGKRSVDVTQQDGMEDWVNLHECEKFKLRVSDDYLA